MLSLTQCCWFFTDVKDWLLCKAVRYWKIKISFPFRENLSVWRRVISQPNWCLLCPQEREMWVRWLCSWKPGNEADMWHQPVIFAFPAIITMWAIVLSSLIGSSLPALLMLSLTLWCNYCKYPPDNSQLSPSQSASNYHHHHPGSSLCCYKGIQVDLWFASSWVQHSYVLKQLFLRLR